MHSRFALPKTQQGYVNCLVNFRSVQTSLNGQFSFGVNTVGTEVNLTVKPDNGADRITATPVGLTGTTNSATSTLSVALHDGPSTMEANTSFALTATAGDALAPYANNERVEKVTLTAFHRQTRYSHPDHGARQNLPSAAKRIAQVVARMEPHCGAIRDGRGSKHPVFRYAAYGLRLSCFLSQNLGTSEPLVLVAICLLQPCRQCPHILEAGVLSNVIDMIVQ